MRRILPLIALAAFATPASAATGGIDVPPTNGPVTEDGGGAVYETPKRKAPAKKRKRAPRRRASRGPVLSSFAVRSKRLYLMGAPVTVAFRIDGRSALRDVRIYLVPVGSRTPASTIKLGPLAAREEPPGPADRLGERHPRAGRLHRPHGREGRPRAPPAPRGGHQLHRHAGLPAPPLPRGRPVLLRRRRRALRRRAQGPHPPGPGSRGGGGHARGRTPGRHGEGGAVPGLRGGPLHRSDGGGRGPRLRVHAPQGRLDPREPRARSCAPASAWARWATPAARSAPTSISRSGPAEAGTAAGSRSTRCRCCGPGRADLDSAA